MRLRNRRKLKNNVDIDTAQAGSGDSQPAYKTSQNVMCGPNAHLPTLRATLPMGCTAMLLTSPLCPCIVLRQSQLPACQTQTDSISQTFHTKTQH